MHVRWLSLTLLLTMTSHAADRDGAYREALRAELAGISAPLVGVEDARRLIAQGAVILDTRTREEFAVSHLPGARFVSFGAWQYLTGPALPLDLPRDRPILVYCTIGWRSGKTVEALRARGFDRAVNLEGGIIQWHNEGGALVDAKGNPTKRVHPYSERWAQFIRD